MKRGTTFNEVEFRGAITLFFQEAIDVIAEGYSLNTPVANIRPSITGGFANKDESFNPSKHVLSAALSPGLDLALKMPQSSVEKVKSYTPAPDILDFVDHNTKTSNSVATKGGLGEIKGSELKFNPANTTDGIFFVPTGGGAATQVTVVMDNKPGRLTFQIPSTLAAGTYKVEVRKSYTQANELRRGETNAILTVA